MNYVTVYNFPFSSTNNKKPYFFGLRPSTRCTHEKHLKAKFIEYMYRHMLVKESQTVSY